MCVLDLRVYRVVAGRRSEFVEAMRDGSVPLLRNAGVDVIAYGASLHDENHAYLIRSFRTLDERNQALEAFYSSDVWLGEWEERIMALIESYEVAVMPFDEATAEQLSLRLR